MDKQLSDLSLRLEYQIKSYAKRLAYKIDLSLEQDFVHDMYVLWLELDLTPEALLWTAIKHGMSDISRSRKYKFSVAPKLKFVSYEQLVTEMYSRDNRTIHLDFEKILTSRLIHKDNIEDILILDELLSFLSPRERSSFILYYGYGYTGVEIGEMLGVTRSMISRYRSRALKKMRRMLND